MILSITDIPSSSKDGIAGWLDYTLKVKVKAAPEKGKANKAVIKVLEQLLNLQKGSVTIESGLTSSKKVVEINCSDENSVQKQLASYSK